VRPAARVHEANLRVALVGAHPVDIDEPRLHALRLLGAVRAFMPFAIEGLVSPRVSRGGR
jgi:hypothetical protein